MKKLTMLLTGIFMCANLMAQPETDTTKTKKDVVKMKLPDGTEITIESKDLSRLDEMDVNAIMSKVSRKVRIQTAQRNEEWREIDSLLEQGIITKEEALRRQEELLKSMEREIEMEAKRAARVYNTSAEDWQKWSEEYSEAWQKWAETMRKKAEEQKDNPEASLEMPPMPPLPPMPNRPPGPSRPGSPNGEDVVIEKTENGETKRITIGPEGITIVKEKSDKPGSSEKSIREEIKDELEKELELEFGTKKKTEKKPKRTRLQSELHLGWNQMLNENFELSGGSAATDFWRSNNTVLGIALKTRIGGVNSPLHIRYGIDWAWNSFKLNGQNVLHKIQEDDMVNTVFGRQPGVEGISRTKFTNVYIGVPVMLQLDFSKGAKMDRGFLLGVGGHFGVLTRSKRFVNYNDFDGMFIRERQVGDFNMNPFRYGVMAQVGYHVWKLTYRLDLNPMFENNRGPHYQISSLTLGLVF